MGAQYHTTLVDGAFILLDVHKKVRMTKNSNIVSPRKKGQRSNFRVSKFSKKGYTALRLNPEQVETLKKKILIIFFHSSEVLKLILRLSSYFLNPEPQRLFPPRENTIRKY